MENPTPVLWQAYAENFSQDFSVLAVYCRLLTTTSWRFRSFVRAARAITSDTAPTSFTIDTKLYQVSGG